MDPAYRIAHIRDVIYVIPVWQPVPIIVLRSDAEGGYCHEYLRDKVDPFDLR